MKNILALLIALIMVFSLVSCGNGGSGEDPEKTDKPSTPNTTLAEDAPDTSRSEDGDGDNGEKQETDAPPAPSGEIYDFKVAIEGIPAEWQKGIGNELYGMEMYGDDTFEKGYLEKFGNVSHDDYNKLLAYFDTLTYDEKLDGVYNCPWGQLQIGHNEAGSEMTVSWYVLK